MINFKDYIRSVEDFPIKGVLFRDISPLLANQKVFNCLVNKIKDYYLDKNIDVIAGVDARGFIFASVLAYTMNKPLVLIRKKNKLPFSCYSYSYNTEYSQDTMQIHTDALNENQKLLICDDVLATGGTAIASIELIKNFNNIQVDFCFIIELEFLKAKNKIKNNIYSLIKY